MIKELYLQGRANERQTEDWLYLERVRGLNRNATLGPLDTKLEKRKKRATCDQQAFEARKLKASTSARVHVELENESYEDSADDITTYSPPVPVPRRKMKKKESLPDKAYLIADVAGISNRALTQLAAANIKQGDSEDLSAYNLSVNTIARRRKRVRTETAQEILKKQLEESSDKRFVLHWDGKIIKSLIHTGKDVENVAVILTGTDGQEILLSIIGIDGPSTADNETQKIIKVCENIIIFFCNDFDI